MWTLFKAYLRDEEGQTSTEYILLVAVVALIVIKFKSELQNKINTVLGTAFTQIDRELTNPN